MNKGSPYWRYAHHTNENLFFSASKLYTGIHFYCFGIASLCIYFLNKFLLPYFTAPCLKETFIYRNSEKVKRFNNFDLKEVKEIK